MTPTKETIELLDALGAVGARAFTALADDGKVSFVEALAFASDLGKITKAISGAGSIPGELAKADGEAKDYLRNTIVDKLKEAGITHRIQDITDMVLAWLICTVDTVQFIRNAPPTALPA